MRHICSHLPAGCVRSGRLTKRTRGGGRGREDVARMEGGGTGSGDKLSGASIQADLRIPVDMRDGQQHHTTILGHVILVKLCHIHKLI